MSLVEAVILNGFSDEIHGLSPMEKIIKKLVMNICTAITKQYEQNVWIGLVQSEFTPVEIATSGLHGIYPYRRMSVVESGSSDASA